MRVRPVRAVYANPGVWLAGAAMLLGFSACQEELPTGADPSLIPVNVTTVELEIPFEDFASGSQVFGGYGRASELGGGIVANDFGDGLQSATLLRFGRYPAFASVIDTLGTTRPDSALTFLSGRILARIDTIGSVLSGPVQITAEALTEPWDVTTSTWQSAVDSAGSLVPWSAEGGGSVEAIGSAVWDPAEGDSLQIVVDSARLASWADSTDFSRGVRLTTSTPGVRIEVQSALLWLRALPSINPDTIIDVLADTEGTTFIYDPLPDPPPDGLRVGGTPAWRSVIEMDLPTELNGPPDLCANVGCPVAITEDVVSFASIRLTTRMPPAAFAPSDTLSIDLRSVLAPALLPKSPIGESLIGTFGQFLNPDFFGPLAGSVVEIPITGFVRDLIRGETLSGDPITNTVALLSLFEPLALEFFSFEGEGSAAAPELRLILTFSNGIGS